LHNPLFWPFPMPPQPVPDWRELSFDEPFNIGLVIGASSSGKTQLLRHCFGEPISPSWNDNAVVSQFPDPATGKFDNKRAADEAIDRLSSVGLGSIPTWMRPYSCLSNGEQARARLARQINDGV
jgi:ABC-type ATPase with predicted acetyltransferase domain